jgi:hypothetical protein
MVGLLFGQWLDLFLSLGMYCIAVSFAHGSGCIYSRPLGRGSILNEAILDTQQQGMWMYVNKVIGVGDK